jgi:hypothetical protein
MNGYGKNKVLRIGLSDREQGGVLQLLLTHAAGVTVALNQPSNRSYRLEELNLQSAPPAIET